MWLLARLRKFNNLEERSIKALNAKCRSGRKVKLPLSSLVEILSHGLAGPNFAARIPITVIMIVITNRKTRICHNRKVNLLFTRFLTPCFLVSESLAAGKSSCISNCIIAVDMAPSNEPLDSASHKMLYSFLQMIMLFIKSRTLIGLGIFTSSVDNFLSLRMSVLLWIKHVV